MEVALWRGLRRILQAVGIGRADPRFEAWHHPAYRLPLTTAEPRSRFDPRRAELALAWLRHAGAVDEARVPEPASWTELAAVHDAAWLERIVQPEELAAIFAVEPWDVSVDALLDGVRRITGGTIAAARSAWRRGGTALNLAGGFHHARRSGGAGFCAVHDVAVALAVLRREGLDGRVAVLDLDAHPHDGTVDLLGADPAVWLGSLSGVDWGVDRDRPLPQGTGDEAYLDALDALLATLPPVSLAFVLAGGDVLAGDALGRLGLTLEGCAARDLRVSRHLGATPAVWLPAGGYGPDAWRALAGTGLVLAFGEVVPVPAEADPLRTRYAELARGIAPAELGSGAAEGIGFGPGDTAELEVELGLRRASDGRFLGYYTRQGIELALEVYGILPALERLGYGALRVELAEVDLGHRFRLVADAPAPGGHLLVESVLARGTVAGKPVLYVHWLTLRHPLAAFRQGRAPLPGQEVPGLGMAREAGELLLRMATRLGLAGVALRPAWFHVAWACRHRYHFVDPELQRRFAAILEATAGQDPAAISRALAAGEVKVDGEVVSWEPGEMVEWVVEAAVPGVGAGA